MLRWIPILLIGLSYGCRTNAGEEREIVVRRPFKDSDVSMRMGKTANGQDAFIIENSSDIRLEKIRVTINRKDYAKDYSIAPRDTFFITAKQATVFTEGQRVTHIGLHADVDRERKHFHWDIP